MVSLLVDLSLIYPDKFLVHLSPTKMQEMNIQNHCVEIIGKDSKMIVCPVQVSDECSNDKILMNRLMRHNLEVLLGDPVIVRPSLKLHYCTSIDIAINYSEAIKGLNRNICLDLVKQYFRSNRVVLCERNKFIVRQGLRAVEFVVAKVEPSPYALIDLQLGTKLNYLTDIKRYKMGEKTLSDISYEDFGGYTQQLQQLRELEFPLRFPSLFQQLKVGHPHVIMHGPEGVGKLLLAKAFASETNAHFVLLDESMTKGVSSNLVIVRIRTKLEEAKKNSPSVVCFNGLHEIAPRMMIDTDENKILIREIVKMLKQLEQEKNCVVILIGITHLLSQVNSGVLHHFYNTKNDKNISFQYPSIFDRNQILKINTRNLKLSSNFNFDQLAEGTETYTSANLATLCKKVAWWVCKHENSIGVEDEVDETESFLNQVVTLADFLDIIDETFRDSQENDLFL